MSNALAALRAKKAAAAGKAGTPTKAAKVIGKPTKAAEVEADEDLEDDEQEVVAKPAAKKPLIKGKKAPAKKVIEEEPEEVEEDDLDDEEQDADVDLDSDVDTDDDEDLEDEEELEEEEEEEVVKPAPKKPASKGKAPVKKVVEEEPEDEEDEEELEEEEEELEEEEEEEVAKPAPKKPASKGKAPVKKATASKPVAKSSTPAKSGGLFGSTTKAEPKARREFVEGDTITREEIIKRFAEERGISQADAARGFQDIEAFMLEEIFPYFSANFFGVKFRRTVTEAQYREGAGGLDVKTDGLTTEISAHIAVRACITIGKEKQKGKFIKGEFVPGHVDAKGKFVRDN